MLVHFDNWRDVPRCALPRGIARVTWIVLCLFYCQTHVSAQEPAPAAPTGSAGSTGETSAELQAQPEPQAQPTPSELKSQQPPDPPLTPEAQPQPQQPALEHTHIHTHYGAHAHVNKRVGPAPAASASDQDIDVGALRAVPRPDAQSYLTLSPGVVLTNHSGIGHAASISLRGFQAGEGQDIEFTVDGVPINEPSNAHEHGYADTRFVIPETVQRVHIQQGTFDPQQSDFAVAGSAAYTLGVEERGLRLKVGYGQFAEQRAMVLWAPRESPDGTFTALDLSKGDGFGPNRAHQHVSLLSRYEHNDGPLKYAILLGSHAQEFDSAGVIRDDRYEARQLPCASDAKHQFFCTDDPEQGGSMHRHLLSGKLQWTRPDRRYELQAYGMLRGLRIREDFTGTLNNPLGDGQDEQYKTTTIGMRSAYIWTPTLWGRRQRLALGVTARHDSGYTRMWRIRMDSGIPYETVFDRALDLTHVGGYLQFALSPLSAVRLLGGARVDTFAFHTENEAAADSDRVGTRLPKDARDAWGTAMSPRGSLIVALTAALDWTLSAGLGVRSSDAQALSQGEQAPFARVTSLETGPTLHARLSDASLEAHAFGFATRVSDDLVFNETQGRNTPVGPSNRYGASIDARLRIRDQHDTLLSATYANARAISRGTSIWQLGAGDPLPYVPRVVLRLDHASRAQFDLAGHTLQLTAAAGLSWVGSRPLPLNQSSRPISQLDASLRARLALLELGIELTNVFDVRNRAQQFYYASNFGSDDDARSMRAAYHFSAGTPRTFMVTLTLYLDELDKENT